MDHEREQSQQQALKPTRTSGQIATGRTTPSEARQRTIVTLEMRASESIELRCKAAGVRRFKKGDLKKGSGTNSAEHPLARLAVGS